MGRHFVPDKHDRIRKRSEKNQEKQEVSNQPTPVAYTISLFKPKPRDKVWQFYVNPEKNISPDKLRDLLQGYFHCMVKVYASYFLTSWCIVELSESVERRLIDEYVEKALGEAY